MVTVSTLRRRAYYPTVAQIGFPHLRLTNVESVKEAVGVITLVTEVLSHLIWIGQTSSTVMILAAEVNMVLENLVKHRNSVANPTLQE
jgi:hypothetical protein